MHRVRAQARLLLPLAGAGAAIALASCAASEPFHITQLTYPSRLTGTGGEGTVTLQWSGDPTFPVTVVFAPPSRCSAAPSTCAGWRHTFDAGSNPLTWSARFACAGAPAAVSGSPYSVYAVDAAGQSTQRFDVAIACSFTGGPVAYSTAAGGAPPAMATALRAPDETPWGTADILRSIGVALALLAIVLMRALALTAILERRLREHPPHERAIPAVLAVFLTAVLALLLDPGAGADVNTLWAFIGLLLAVTVLSLVLSVSRAIVLHAMTGLRGSVRVSRGALLTSLLLVVVCRLAGAQPGLFCGGVLSYQPGPGKVVPHEPRHVMDVVGDGAMLIVGAAAWAAWSPLKAAAAGGGALVSVFSTMVAALFMGSITSVLARPLLPSPHGGGATDRVSIASWTVFGLAAFLLVHVMLDSSPSTPDPDRMYIVLVVMAVIITVAAYVSASYLRPDGTTRLSPR